MVVPGSLCVIVLVVAISIPSRVALAILLAVSVGLVELNGWPGLLAYCGRTARSLLGSGVIGLNRVSFCLL